jgi:hypothetical protein
MCLAACGGGGSGGSSTNATLGTSTSSSSSSSSGSGSTASATISCASTYKFSAPGGQMLNNVWNSSAAGSFQWSQCLVRRQVNGSTQYGWAWNWPDRGNTGPVFAYPEIGVGSSPWTNGPQGDSRFPVQVSAVKSLVVSYDIETTGVTGSRNLAAETWITSTGTKPASSSITTEFMIWSETVPSTRTPSGTKRADVTIDNQAWEVWADDSGTFGAGGYCCWTYVAYRAKNSTPTITYDLKKLIDDATGRGYVNQNHYITDLELGNEIMGGTGTTWIKSLSVTVNK